MDSEQDMSSETHENIKGYVRCRPINTQERRSKNRCVEFTESRQRVIIRSQPEKTFTFDHTFTEKSTQSEVYREVVRPLVEEVLRGYNCTVIAYGQTGTGKTYTLTGDPSLKASLSSQNKFHRHCGLVPRALYRILSGIANPQLTTVKVSFLELKGEELSDLLASGNPQHRSKLEIVDDPTATETVRVNGLKQVVVRDVCQINGLLQQKTQDVGFPQHGASHRIFTITVVTRDTSNVEADVMISKLNFVDLAGNNKTLLRTVNKINLRERVLVKDVVEGAWNTSCRNSKLTRLLQDAFGGKSKTSIIGTIAPTRGDLVETLSTMEFISEAKNITNRPKLNRKLSKKILLEHIDHKIALFRVDVVECQKNYFSVDPIKCSLAQNMLGLLFSDKLEDSGVMAPQSRMKHDSHELPQKRLHSSASETTDDLAHNPEQVYYDAQSKKGKIGSQSVEQISHVEKIDARSVMTAIVEFHDKCRRHDQLRNRHKLVVDKLLAVNAYSLKFTSMRADVAVDYLIEFSALVDEIASGLQEESKLLRDIDVNMKVINAYHQSSSRHHLGELSCMNGIVSSLRRDINQYFTDKPVSESPAEPSKLGSRNEPNSPVRCARTGSARTCDQMTTNAPRTRVIHEIQRNVVKQTARMTFPGVKRRASNKAARSKVYEPSPAEELLADIKLHFELEELKSKSAKVGKTFIIERKTGSEDELSGSECESHTSSGAHGNYGKVCGKVLKNLEA